MPRNFKLGLPAIRDRRGVLRAAVYALLAANLIAAFFIVRPWGGSAEDLEQQLLVQRQQVKQRQGAIERLRLLVAKAEKARAEGDRFLAAHFLDRRTASSAILTELGNAGKKAGLRPRDHAYTFEAIEGSDDLTLMTISANYEGSYAALMQFVNIIDRMNRFLIVEDMQATPTQQPGTLAIRMQIDAFVREGDGRS
jgi:Tfp pilus assembly protein PilO